MKAEIISVGSEMTSGQNLDTNAQWLSRQYQAVVAVLEFLPIQVLGLRFFQEHVDAGRPPQKLRRTKGIVFEEKIVHRMFTASRHSFDSFDGMRTKAVLMRFAPDTPFGGR